MNSDPFRVPDPTLLARHEHEKSSMQRVLGETEIDDEAVLVVRHKGQLKVYGCGFEADSATRVMGMMFWAGVEVYAATGKRPPEPGE